MAAVTPFVWWDRDLTLFDHPYNNTRRNERAVEIACLLSWLAGKTGRTLELGNVLRHYLAHDHRVVDRYERALGVANIDIFDETGRYRWIFSVSTVEHVRWDEQPKDPEGSVNALHHLRSLLKPNGELFVTAPLGHHPTLDDYLMDGGDADRACTFVREGDSWRQTEHLTWRPYGKTTIWADSVWIGEWKG